VLLDKDLNVLLAGMTQGRRTFANTMKYIFMTTSASFGNVLSMAIAAAVLPFLPLLAGQILLINLLTDFPRPSSPRTRWMRRSCANRRSGTSSSSGTT